MLLTKTIKIKAREQIKYYKDKGYIILPIKDNRGRDTFRNSIIEVKTEDLPDGSNVVVSVQCDSCGNINKNKKWQSYIRDVHENGKCYCRKCSNKLFGVQKRIEIQLKKGKSFKKWCYDNLSKEDADEILLRWDYNLNEKDGNKISPENVTYSSKGLNEKGYWLKCLKNPEHISEQKNIGGFTRGQKGNFNCIQCNSISITHPYLAKFLVNEKDSLKYSMGSAIKIPMKCPDCGFEKLVSPNTLMYQGFSCPICSAGYYPEKYVYSMLEQLGVNFKTQLSKNSFDWCGNYYYDFYVDNCIIETNGMQHYREVTGWVMHLDEVQENDKCKEQTANENGIEDYIILDCRKSDMKWIKNKIMLSKLPHILDFKENDINWLKCHEYACSGLVKKASNLYNSGIKDTVIIAEKLKIARTTATMYLNQGFILGWCSYNSKEESKANIKRISEKNCRKVICLTTKEVFNSLMEAAKQYNFTNGSSISQCCENNYDSAGVHPKTGEKLIWMYYEEYLIKNQTLAVGWLDNYVNSHSNKIICLTTGEIFNSQVEAYEKYNSCRAKISECCSNKRKSAGKLPDGTKLVWKYYSDTMI